MTHASVKANAMLLVAAAIWGLGFVAQRLGMDHLGPYSFNGIRFLLGALSLLPLILWLKPWRQQPLTLALLCKATLPVGLLLFIGASLQQVGLLYTTAANAGFITGLYIILVPILGLLLGHVTHANVWVGCVLAVFGLFLLSVSDSFSVNFGDALQLLGALFWAGHLLTIDHFAKKVPPLLLACGQFFICGVLSLVVGVALEAPTAEQALAAWQPIAYAGLISVGVAYTLQVLAQKEAHPAHAAIILSLEAVFAAIGGMLILGESLSLRAYAGCGLMLLGMLIAQFRFRWFWKTFNESPSN